MIRNYIIKNICIIPARGGSKRIPLKNLKLFFGKPIIYYSIKKALNSKLFDQVIVSTDNKNIAKISEKIGAKIHIRDPKYADDFTDTISVIKHVIQDLDKKKQFEKVCCIYPTSIFFTEKKLKEAFKKLKKKNCYIFSASRFHNPIDRSFYKIKDRVKMLFKKNYIKRSQDLRTYFYDAAQFYLGWRHSWVSKKKVFSSLSDFIEFKHSEFQDIDDKEDWEIAKKKWKKIKSKRKY